MRLKHRPDVTIVLLARDDEAALSRSISDARAQRDVTSELVRHDAAGDLAATARAARGEWIAFLAAGDRWHPGRLRHTLDVVAEAATDWIYGARVLVGDREQVLDMALPEEPRTLTRRLRAANVIGAPSTVLCRRSLFLDAEPFDERLEVLTFWRAWLALARLAPAAATPELLAAERVDRHEELRRPGRALAELRLLRDEGLVDAGERAYALRLATDLRVCGRPEAAAATLVRTAGRHGRPQDLGRALMARRKGGTAWPGFARPDWLGFQPPAEATRTPARGGCEISVVIATRNRGAFLRQAVASALAQLDVDLEVIVVDDASDEEAAKRALRFDDRRVRVHARPRPGGAGRARDDALALARGEWIAFLDDDDLFAPTRLRAHLERAAGAGLGYCGQILVDPARRVVGTLPAPTAEGLAERLRSASAIGGPSAVIARTELLREVGGFGGGYHALGDWDLWVRLAARASAFALPDLLVAYAVHPGNMHVAGPDRLLADFERFRREHDLLPAAETELIDWLARELAVAGRARDAARLHLRVARRHRRAVSVVRALRTLRDRSRPAGELPSLVGPEWLRQYGPVDGR
jgi:glycosyltransferase involved in cell wall biosynthesis